MQEEKEETYQLWLHGLQPGEKVNEKTDHGDKIMEVHHRTSTGRIVLANGNVYTTQGRPYEAGDNRNNRHLEPVTQETIDAIKKRNVLSDIANRLSLSTQTKRKLYNIPIEELETMASILKKYHV